MEEAAQDWRNAAISASNLSETELLFGDIAAAVATAERAVALADRAGDAASDDRQPHDPGRRAPRRWRTGKGCGSVRRRRATAAGRAAGIPAAVLDCRGIGTATCFCRRGEPPRRATGRLRPCNGRAEQLGFLTVALDTLTLGRAHLALALQSLASEPSAEPRATMRAPPPPGSMRPSKACAPRAKRSIFLAACSPAPLSAAPSATGTARNATLTKQKRSPNRD